LQRQVQDQDSDELLQDKGSFFILGLSKYSTVICCVKKWSQKKEAGSSRQEGTCPAPLQRAIQDSFGCSAQEGLESRRLK
jgi:hypothetical protein